MWPETDLKKVIYRYIVYVALLQVVLITFAVVFAFMVLLERENCL